MKFQENSILTLCLTWSYYKERFISSSCFHACCGCFGSASLVNHDSSSDSRSTSGSCVREIAESHFGNAKQSRYVQTNLHLPPIHSNSSSFDDQRDRTSQQGHPKAELESVIRKMEEGTRLVFKFSKIHWLNFVAHYQIFLSININC